MMINKMMIGVMMIIIIHVGDTLITIIIMITIMMDLINMDCNN